MGAWEFVMRLLARVTGEKSEAMYVWHKCWRVPFLKKKNGRKRFPGSYSEIKQKIQWDPETKNHATLSQNFEWYVPLECS